MSSQDNPRPFHLAIAVGDLALAREFYGGLLGCSEGRSADHWVDFNLYGHQLVCHVSEQPASEQSVSGQRDNEPRSSVDGDAVPVPHFGVVLSMADWGALAERLSAAGVTFEIEPRVRFAGEPGEQGTFFLYDPFGNALEFKGFKDVAALFEK